MSIEEIREAMNRRRDQLLGSDPQYAYLAGQLSVLQAQEEKDAGDSEGE